MINEGIINLYKPQNMTSHDCVQALRRLTKVKRIGHTGTLDPMATGVLPICIGSTARIMEYLDLDFKIYRCEMTLGLETTTQDIWGEVIRDTRETLSGSRMPTPEQVREAFSPCKGLIDQRPPQYSALKVNGKRLYEYARAGETVEIKTRKVYIKELVITEMDLANLRVTFEVTCSKGTYVRTICSDIGERLGCGAAMSALCRLASGVFELHDAIRLETLASLSETELSAIVHLPDYPLVHFGKIVLNPSRGVWFQNGGAIGLSDAVVEAEPEYKEKEAPFAIRDEWKRAYCVYQRERNEDVFLGVAFYEAQEKKWLADKVFFRRS